MITRLKPHLIKNIKNFINKEKILQRGFDNSHLNYIKPRKPRLSVMKHKRNNT